MRLDYTILIRTLGGGGEKYSKLLKSIEKLHPIPKEVIVMLPEGYKLPEERLGWERFEYCPKGMVKQRAYGIDKVKEGKYILFLDDDLEFESTMVSKLAEPIINQEATVTFPILSELLPQKSSRKILAALSGSAVPMFFNSTGEYIQVLKTGGWLYNSNIRGGERYYSESLTGACYMATLEASQRLKIEDEFWVERPRFAQWEDQVIAYKYHINGYKIMGLNNIEIEHLDGGSGSKDKTIDINYAAVVNRSIFWHRFIYSLETRNIKKSICLISLIYNVVSNILITTLVGIVKRDFKRVVKTIKGYIDAYSYIKSRDYKMLSSPIIGEKQ